MNPNHAQKIREAQMGRTSFVYRGWMVHVYPQTVKRPDGRRAVCEAMPLNQDDLPEAFKGKKVAGPVYEPLRQAQLQINYGLRQVLPLIDQYADNPDAWKE